jgi:hypothetical protein
MKFVIEIPKFASILIDPDSIFLETHDLLLYTRLFNKNIHHDIMGMSIIKFIYGSILRIILDDHDTPRTIIPFI